MKTLLQKSEDTLIAQASPVSEDKVEKNEIKDAVMHVEKPLMRYFDLLEDSSPSYVLGYN